MLLRYACPTLGSYIHNLEYFISFKHMLEDSCIPEHLEFACHEMCEHKTMNYVEFKQKIFSVKRQTSHMEFTTKIGN